MAEDLNIKVASATDRTEEWKPSLLSQVGWTFSIGGILGVMISIAYYHSLGAPKAWHELQARAAVGGWWDGEGVGGLVQVGDNSNRARLSSSRRLMQSSSSVLLTDKGEDIVAKTRRNRR